MSNLNPPNIDGYKILRELNRGGMAVVYLAEQVALQRQVALKVMSDHLSADGFKQRFLREARLVASFNHPGIVTIYDVGEQDGHMYLSMEVLEGGDLKQRMATSRLTPDQALQILRDLVNATGFAHQKQVVHRDIKPENVMFSSSGQVVLTDFGIAKALDTEADNLTREGSTIGTPAYMSPEQFEGDVDFRTDFYSIGIVFYQMLTGERPFRANSLPAYMFKHTSEAVPPLPEELRSFSDLVEGLLAKQRDERWSDPGQIQRYIDGFISGQPIAPPSISAPTTSEWLVPTGADEDATYIPEVSTGEAVNQSHSASGTGRSTQASAGAQTASNPGVFNKMTIAALMLAMIAAVALMFYVSQPDSENLPVGNAETSVEHLNGNTKAESSPAIDRASVAVLPFDDVSQEQNQRYFADGLADTLTQVLGGVKELKVAARAAAFSFRHDALPPAEIASELLVAHILSGSVQTAENRVRVIAELILAETGEQVWSQTFDGDLDDIFAIQDQIAAEVVTAIEGVLVTGISGDRYRPALEAFEQLMIGYRQQEDQNTQNLKAAEANFREAISLDPDYALAYVALADNLALQDVFVYGYQDSYSGLPSSASRELQKPLIDKALTLNPRSGEAHASLARITIDEASAETAFQQALSLAPNYAPAYLRYGEFLSTRKGRYTEALEILEQARSLDPVSDPIKYAWIKNIWSVGRAEEAISLLNSAVRSNPNFPPYYKLMARWQLKLGQAGNALRWIRALRELDPDNPSHWGEFAGECFIIESLGKQQEYNQCVAEFIAAHPDSITARRQQALRTGGSDALITLYRQVVAEEPGNDYRANQLAFELSVDGRFEDVIQVISRSHPELFSEQPIVTGQTIWPALDLAAAYKALDRQDELLHLTAAAEDAVLNMRIIEGPGYTWGNEPAVLAALQGQHELALNRLEQAVNSGWRFGAKYLKYIPAVQPFAKRPRFQALLQQIDEYASEQSAWYEANRDKPLL